MGARPLDYDKFAKLLALAGSDRDGEALAALGAMRRMLDDSGIGFGDLAHACIVPRAGAPISDLHLELQIKGLAKKLGERELEIRKLRGEIETWRELAWSNTEQLTRHNDTLTARLREQDDTIARARTAPRTNAEKRSAVRAYLEDPERARLSDREIARRAGVAPQTVCNWRKRLGIVADDATRVFRRAGKDHLMRTAGIGKQPAAA